jgi:hypothetical protein
MLLGRSPQLIQSYPLQKCATSEGTGLGNGESERFVRLDLSEQLMDSEDVSTI